MNHRQVVVRRGEGPGERKIGELIERLRPGQVRVRWPDGVEEELELKSRYVIADEESLKYQHLVHPEVLGERLRDNPAELILQLLRESRETMKPGEIRERLAGLDLDRAAVDRAWKAAKKLIDQHEHVILSGKPAAYRWTDTPADPHAKLKALPIAEALRRLVEDKPPEQERKALADGVAARATEPVTKLVAQSVGVEVTQPPAAAADLLKKPLTAGVALAEFPPPILNALARRPIGEPSVWALLACVPRKLRASDDIDLVATLGADASQRLIENALEELRNGKESRADLVAAMSGLVERVTRSSHAHRLPTVLLIEAMSALPAKGRGQPARAHLAHVIAEQVRQWRPDSPQIPSEQMYPLADAVAALPLEPRGAKAELLAVLHSFSPEIVRAAVWWRNVTLQDVISTGEGLLHRAWSDPVIAEEVIRPPVSRALASATTRRDLAQVIAAPAVVVDQVDPEQLSAAWEKVAQADERAAEWLDVMRADTTRQQLEEQLAQALAAGQAAHEERDLLSTQHAELEARAVRLERLLSDAHVASRGVTKQELRQRAIDALRPVVALAIEAESMIAESQPTDVILDRIHGLVAAHGLSPIEACGATVPFDPAKHEAVADEARPGAPVSVLRPGYTWQWNDEEIVMEKALVTP